MHLFKKLALKSLKMFVAFGFALSTMSMPYIQVHAVGEPGTVSVDKVATDIGGGLYEITLTITGVPVVKSSDIVLVMDNSTSMAGAKLTAMKTAAKNFVDTILARGEGHRIAIVKFAENPALALDFSQNATTLRNTIDGLTASGYTHLEGGIYLARQLLAGASAIATNTKNIVVLGDGMPTRGYDFNAVYTGPAYTLTAGQNHGHNTCTANITDTDRNNPANYSGRYDFLYGNSLSVSNTSNMLVTKTFAAGTCSNGVAATFTAQFSLANSVLWQAQQAWASGYQLFSIGLSVDATGEAVLTSIDNAGYFNGNTDNLGGIYAQIASSILQAGTNAILYDKMGAHFTFQNFQTGYISSAYTFNHTTDILTWDIGVIGSAPLILKYIVKIDEGLPSGTYPTNEYATLDYTNVSGQATETPLPEPEVIIQVTNVAPVAVDDLYSIAEDGTLNVLVANGVLDNDTDANGDSLKAIKLSDPANGVLTFNIDGSFTYVPTPGWHGTDTFTYKANDGLLDSLPATVTITVEAINHAPSATGQSVSTNEDTPKDITLTGTDPDGNTLTDFRIDVQPDHGTIDLVGNVATYTPEANYNGPDSFEFSVFDGTVWSAPATVLIDVLPINDAPVATPQKVSTPEDTALAILLAGTDLESSITNFRIDTPPTEGVLSGTLPNMTYTPGLNYNGPDSFQFSVFDGTDWSAPATVSITVTPVNDAPLAYPQSVSTPEDTAKNITLTGFDVEGTALTFVIVDAPTHGHLTGTGADVTYTPDADYNGPDSFTFTVSDGEFTSAPATVSITVDPSNDRPSANGQQVSTDEDTAKAITLTGTDPDGDPLLDYEIVSVPAHGILTGTGADRTYTPALNYSGPDSFTFRVSDGNLWSDPATVTITVNPVNDAPVATPQALSTFEDIALPIVLAGTDVDGDTISGFVIVDGPTHGHLTGSGANVTYTPDLDFNGSDSFTFRVYDGALWSDVATVSITVDPVNDAPVAHSDEYVTNEDTTLNVLFPGVLENDTDADLDILEAVLVLEPEHGTLIFNSDGSFEYTPDADWNGVDRFSYYATDGELDSETVKVFITVEAVNDAPIAVDDSFTTPEDTVLNVPAPGILENDSDIDSLSLTAVLEASPANGTLVLNADGSFSYTPNANFNGTDSFAYRAFDGETESYVAIVTIEVTPVNDAPTAANATYTILRGATISRLLARGDVDGDPLTFEIVAGPTRGSLVVNAAGRFTYVHDGIALTSDTFTYRVYDGALYSPTRTIRINFTDLPVPNTAPVVTDSSFNTPFDTALNNDIAPNGSDADGDPVTFILVGQPAHGTVTLSPSGSFHYVPTKGYSGPDSFTYKANDGKDDSNVATANITVAKEIIITPEPTPQAQMPWWWLLGLLPFLLFLIRRPRPEVQEVVMNPDGTITTTWGYLGPRLMHKDYDRDESVLEVVSGDVKVVPPLEKIPYEFDKGRHENIFKTVSDKNAVIRWTIKKKAEELDKELIEKMLEKNKK